MVPLKEWEPKPAGQLGMAFETLGLPITAGGGPRSAGKLLGVLSVLNATKTCTHVRYVNK